jgi:hypothetical protein
MTTFEMILRVRQATRQIDSFVMGALLSEEILLQLNVAQDQFQFVKYKAGQSSLKDLVDIRTSQKIELLTFSSPKVFPIPNSKEFVFPADFRFFDYGLLRGNGSMHMYDILPNNAIENFIQTNYNIPIIRTPKLTVKGNRIVAIHDPEWVVDGFELHYYRKLSPITMENECELPEHTHDAICEIAINIIVGRTVPQEYEISNDILNKKE